MIYDTSPILNLIISFLTGVISGFGIGGGTLLIIYLTMFLSVEQRTAQFVNLLYFIPTAVGSMIPHIKNRRIDWKKLLPTAVSGVVFAIIASYVANKIDTSLLKRIFGLFLIYIGIRELTAKK